MPPFRRALLVVLIVLSAPAPLLACLWDYDTLRDEKRGLPGVAEVLAGKWEKHSPFFYEQRVRKMKELIAREPGNLPAYDNLAVAYEKLGDYDSAIHVMMRKERVKAGEYTTYANLGTFYLHKGDLDEGILYIRKALEINPNAHFGREEYQLQLAEFLRAGRADPRLLKATNFLGMWDGRRLTQEEVRQLLWGVDARPSSGQTTRPTTQAATRPGAGPTAADDAGDPDSVYGTYGDNYDWAYRGSPEWVRKQGFKDNVFDGIVGMIRFGTGTSPELYLALGDLLVLRGDKNLAYRAYQRALELNHPRQEYLKMMMRGLREMIPDRASIEPEAIAADRADAEAWVKAYQEFEDDLLREGKDVDDEANYAPFYRKHGRAVLADPFRVGDYVNGKTAPYLGLACFVAFFTAVPVAVVLVMRRRSRR
jgi:tetratricopeptide (TPR) repeat protein